MLSRPFRGMSAGVLRLLLVLLLGLEAAGGVGLYLNNQPAKAAAPIAPPKKTPTACNGPATINVQNTPRTVLAGEYETFSVILKCLPRAVLTYEVSYPDGTNDALQVNSDASGFSKQRFLIGYKPQKFRETIGVAVSYNGKQQAATRFTVQVPKRATRP